MKKVNRATVGRPCKKEEEQTVVCTVRNQEVDSMISTKQFCTQLVVMSAILRDILHYFLHPHLRGAKHQSTVIELTRDLLAGGDPIKLGSLQVDSQTASTSAYREYLVLC